MAPRALRVGILLGDNLVEEKLFRGTSPVTFGQSLKCALSIPGDRVPHEHVLFVHDQGRVLLRVTKQMTGKLAQGGQGGKITTELQAGEPTDGVWTIALEKGARGKLQLGDATILFQEIAAPPIAPRPVLPASIRGSLGDRIDRRLAVIIGASVCAHLGIAGYAWLQDTDTGSLLSSSVAQQYHQETMEVTLPEEPSKAIPDPGPGAATPVSPVQTARPIVSRPRITTQTPSVASTTDDALKFASILTGSEVGRTGNIDLNSRQPGADLNKQIDEVGNRTVVVGNTDAGFRQREREGIGTAPGPNVDDPTQVTSQPTKAETQAKGRIQIKPLPPEGPGTTLTVGMVLEKINTVYMSGLQRCYKKGLLGDATLSGKVSMSFTVTERGTLEDFTARGGSSEVETCMSSLMGGWHFAIPRDKDGDPTDAPFKLVLALQPS